ncbi:hypothetical protein VCV18_000900 [Metarhizium anisopliae]
MQQEKVTEGDDPKRASDPERNAASQDGPKGEAKVNKWRADWQTPSMESRQARGRSDRRGRRR